MAESPQSLRECKALPTGNRFLAICGLGDINTKSAKNGSTYFEFVLGDASDEVKVRVFSDSPLKTVLTTLKPGTPVKVGGTMGEFAGRPEFRVDALAALADAEKSDPAIMGRLTPVSQQDP